MFKNFKTNRVLTNIEKLPAHALDSGAFGPAADGTFAVPRMRHEGIPALLSDPLALLLAVLGILLGDRRVLLALEFAVGAAVAFVLADVWILHTVAAVLASDAELDGGLGRAGLGFFSCLGRTRRAGTPWPAGLSRLSRCTGTG